MYTTRRRALVIDQLSSGLISVVGLSVILAVAGMMLFLVYSSWPLFQKEEFIEAGELLQVPSSGAGQRTEILFDDTAPVGFVVAQDSADSCRIRARSIKNLGPGAQTKEFSHDLVLRKNPAAAMPTDDIPLQLVRADAAGSEQTSASNVECHAQPEHRILVRDGQSLRSGRLQIVRNFLSSDDIRALSSTTRKELLDARWTVDNGEVLVKPSAQSPSAKVSLNFDLEWSIDDFFVKFPGVSLAQVQFLRRPGKQDGVFVVSTTSSDGQLVRSFSVLTVSENAITGEKESSLNPLPVSEILNATTPPLDSFWIEGRYFIVPQARSALNAIDVESAGLESTRLTFPSSLGQPTALSANFGGASAFVEFSSDTGSKCASVDVGRGIRLAASATNLTAEMPVLWSDSCAPSVRLIAHPHQRAVYRWLQPTNTNNSSKESPHGALLEARELTTGRVAAVTGVPGMAHVTALLDSKGNLIAWSDESATGLRLLKFKAPHLEVSLRSLFSKIHYESYEEASYSWQSTSGTDEFQAKFSLIPLIWGTVKATLYSLLFAVPLAIFAAVYSSEILDRQTRNIVKPTLEMMASVPSVVLGFLAAIVIAPWIENHILSVLLIGVSMPFMLYAAGVFMQIPSARHLTARGLYASRRLLMWVIVGFAVLIWFLSRAGLWIEKTAFGGDLKAFLSGGPGTEGVLWGLLLLPLIFIGLWSVPIRSARNIYRMSVFVLGPVISVWIGSLLSGHTSLREDLLGQYAQRNTLVISIAMGFAIIPIIYSLAEDALTSVPNSLRAGSLACGASVWQTTARVVLPTAASGLFSAVMVGLGRGIGETMIAVMATGNTAVMTMNPFDGLRSMAANIAVELPEAAQGSTHYRILFLSALVLFLFTFTLNSFAEFLRARFRARNKAL